MQDWGVALLLSVQPTDRALSGWALAGCARAWLTRLEYGDGLTAAQTLAVHADA